MLTSGEAESVDSIPDDGQLRNQSQLESIVDAFPNVIHSFGYGSGVFAQDGAASGGMVDLILVTEDSQAFHEANLKRHASHYTIWNQWAGAGLCTAIQRGGANVFFHAMVQVRDPPVMIKYGVVQVDDLLDDLKDWKHLYLAGRLHKPTVSIRLNDAILEAQALYNLPHAVATSLLLLGEQTSPSTGTKTVSLNTLYEEIARLSYIGDARTQAGAEDPHKIHKLVHSTGQSNRFGVLYREPLQMLERRGLISANRDGTVSWNPSDCVSALRSYLPYRLQKASNLQADLSATVARSSRGQSIKGLWTAGVSTSARYVWAKFSKGLLRR